MTRPLAAVLLAGFVFVALARADTPTVSSSHPCQPWQYIQELPLPAAPTEGQPDASKWCDFVVPPSVFDGARKDLGDLRLYDATGVEIPYALRIRRAVNSQQQVTAREFNRAVGSNQSSELTLDLGADPPEHNEVEISMPGIDYRRAVGLEGSADGKTWSKILDKNLMHFMVGTKELEDLRLYYPPSRFRYLRLRVSRDPDVDKEPVKIGQVTVRRKVEVPGEFMTLPAQVGPREATRAPNGPGSAWILDLGAAHVPCEKLLVEIADNEFARDYSIASAGLPSSNESFNTISYGEWKRVAGDARKPLEATFNEQLAARLKLIVTDFRNPPLDLRGAQIVAPARQIVFERKPALAGPVRLFYGNLKAEPPGYDLERNLPALIEPAPVRLKLSDRQPNPAYVPEPLPLSERWPWAIYLVLGAASAVLAAILFSLGRTAVAMHDAAQTPEPTPSA